LTEHAHLPSLVLRLLAMALATSQIQAACAYSPPPLPNYGQAAETLGKGKLSVAAEAGFGTTASWWDASDPTDVDLNNGWVGAGRLRLGLFDSIDVGLVGGYGPQSTFVAGPELKWRFAHVAPEGDPDGPAFHAAWVSGLGIGTSDDYDPDDPDVRETHLFMAPYTGVVGSGGVHAAQMFAGFRFAASETFGNELQDLTLYPILTFGFQFRPAEAWTIYAETDLAGGLTTYDFDDSALLFYPSAGLSFSFDAPWARAPLRTSENKPRRGSPH
jgi:hypothetical protein